MKCLKYAGTVAQRQVHASRENTNSPPCNQSRRDSLVDCRTICAPKPDSGVFHSLLQSGHNIHPPAGRILGIKFKKTHHSPGPLRISLQLSACEQHEFCTATSFNLIYPLPRNPAWRAKLPA